DPPKTRAPEPQPDRLSVGGIGGDGCQTSEAGGIQENTTASRWNRCMGPSWTTCRTCAAFRLDCNVLIVEGVEFLNGQSFWHTQLRPDMIFGKDSSTHRTAMPARVSV